MNDDDKWCGPSVARTVSARVRPASGENPMTPAARSTGDEESRHLTQFHLREAIIDAIREPDGAGAIRALKAFEAYDEFLTAATPPAAGGLADLTCPKCGVNSHDNDGEGWTHACDQRFLAALGSLPDRYTVSPSSGASPETAGLDRDRLAEAMSKFLGGAPTEHWNVEWADDIAAEYARLTPVAGSASEEDEDR